ncbi:hypothetical protein Bca101_011166 [Brassica carinata]
MMFRDITYGPQEAELRFDSSTFGKLACGEEHTAGKNQQVPSPFKKMCSIQFVELLCIEKQCPVAFRRTISGSIKCEEFEANCDAKGDLYDVVGHMKLVNGQSMIGKPTIEVSEVATSRRMVGTCNEVVSWDNAAIEFCQKFRAFESPPSVVLVTTVNPKRLGGTLALSSMSSSRVLVSHPDVVNQVNAEVVTKRETATIGEIFAYMKRESAKPAFLNARPQSTTSCMTLHGTTSDAVAARLRQPESEEAVFVLLGDLGPELSGKPVAELVRNYFETRKLELMCLFEALLSTVGGHTISVSKFHNTISRKKQITNRLQDSPLPLHRRGTIASADGDGVILEGSRVTATMGLRSWVMVLSLETASVLSVGIKGSILQ